MFSFIKKFFERRKALAAEREQECFNLLSMANKCLADAQSLFVDSAKFVSKDEVVSWKKKNKKQLIC